MDAAEFLKKLPFFDGLNESDIDSLIEAANIRIYPKKSSIFRQGDLADRYFIILYGAVKLHMTTIDGKEGILAIYTRGDSFGDVILVDGAIYTHNATALEDSKIIELFAAPMKEMVSRNTVFSLHLLQYMTRQVERLWLENEHLLVMSARERVACFVLQRCLVQRHQLGATKCDTIELPYDKHLAAIRLGMKPETFSRVLKDLQKFGVVVTHNQIQVEDHRILENLCCSKCSASPLHCPLAQVSHLTALQNDIPKSKSSSLKSTYSKMPKSPSRRDI
ncbi:MAG: hypothetical protein CMN55_17275 [Sneathiella sp.]|jgi:CRP-like cAMP-binding protein|uniref:Crp/Fnr family transcriptional regulator n=1 Tax=Sneathiella sp. TaxID=1964365 RepID=UPI000C4F74E3|nr:Crp/Fnr family transcriptional regulator [Sneathiella sp.]MAL80825.1 hypothetical protein [Sneathiella sp.]|tara:strand:- start:4729 stop:5559 length:831 start_codon:yes stop_codon:yes gene_type:complete